MHAGGSGDKMCNDVIVTVMDFGCKAAMDCHTLDMCSLHPPGLVLELWLGSRLILYLFHTPSL